ncbi:hypothetical protein HHK36_010350 [Tetracentron sinense]|uniref:Uncharacterized protein n=1 Tax=Tetracentron sinense TaxID=13715 RepID=A0A834ZCQ8_TETSI|nr:hypothetical protein HHK36_010350 [Tetracentron sinense]
MDISIVKQHCCCWMVKKPWLTVRNRHSITEAIENKHEKKSLDQPYNLFLEISHNLLWYISSSSSSTSTATSDCDSNPFFPSISEASDSCLQKAFLENIGTSILVAENQLLNQIECELPPEHPLTNIRPLCDSLGHTPLQHSYNWSMSVMFDLNVMAVICSAIAPFYLARKFHPTSIESGWFKREIGKTIPLARKHGNICDGFYKKTALKWDKRAIEEPLRCFKEAVCYSKAMHDILRFRCEWKIRPIKAYELEEVSLQFSEHADHLVQEESSSDSEDDADIANGEDKCH